MIIEVAKLKCLIEAAYDKGYCQGVGKEAYLAELMAEFGGADKEDVLDDEFRLWSVDELRLVAEGSRFEHSRFGPCHVAIKQGEKFMVFASPLMYLASFNCDGHPWDMPMRRLNA